MTDRYTFTTEQFEVVVTALHPTEKTVWTVYLVEDEWKRLSPLVFPETPTLKQLKAGVRQHVQAHFRESINALQRLRVKEEH